jgi:hypothetical protein
MTGPFSPLFKTSSKSQDAPDGKKADERDLILQHLAEVEPLLRATCTHEIDASRSVDDVVAELVSIGSGPRR